MVSYLLQYSSSNIQKSDNSFVKTLPIYRLSTKTSELMRLIIENIISGVFIPKIWIVKNCVLVLLLLSPLCYGFLSKDEVIYILKNHKEKGFYFEGEVSKDTLKVIIDMPTNSEKVFINFAESRYGGILTFYSTVDVFDKKPSYELMEYLLRANNFNESLGFFYIYYDINLDKWFIDYSVRIRQEDITKSSLISIIKIVSIYAMSSRSKIKSF